ncbi:MAG: hypothetical protein ABIJ56_14435 [Pseudomonadota bacterium]
MSQAAFIEVEFVEEGGGKLADGFYSAGGRDIAAVKIIRVEGAVGGYLEGIAAGDVVFISRGKGWALKRTCAGTFFLAAGKEGDEGQSVASVSVAGIMKKVAGGGR